MKLAIPATVIISMFSLHAAEPRIQGRSMVISQGGIVATEQPLASQVAVQILAEGGNAADAAIAANAMMGLVSPMMNGIGGDMFCLVYEAKSGKTYGLNASGWATRPSTRSSSGSRAVATPRPCQSSSTVTATSASLGRSR